MKKKFRYFVFTSIIFLLFAGLSSAQPPPGGPPGNPGGPPCPPNNPNCPQIPIDSATGLLLAAGAVFGGKKLYSGLKK